MVVINTCPVTYIYTSPVITKKHLSLLLLQQNKQNTTWWTVDGNNRQNRHKDLTFSCSSSSSGDTVNIPELPDSPTKVSAPRLFKGSQVYREFNKLRGPRRGAGKPLAWPAERAWHVNKSQPDVAPAARHQVEDKLKQRAMLCMTLVGFRPKSGPMWLALLLL